MLLRRGIWRCWCGHETSTARGNQKTFVRAQLQAGSWKFWSGRGDRYCPWGVDTCALAAEGGHLEVLIWARENNCPWDENTLKRAAESECLEVWQWAKANGCPGWDTHLYTLH